MKEHLIDLIAAVVVLVAGIVLIIIDERDLGTVAITTALAYVAGSLREKPGGLDEMHRLGDIDIEYADSSAEAEDGEVA